MIRRRKFSRLLVGALLLALAVLLAACPGVGVPPAVTSVTINEPDQSVVVGGTFTFTATVDAVGGANPAVTWSSSDETVATVDTNGVVTGVAVGTATITATSVFNSAISDTVTVTVTATPLAPAVNSVNIDQGSGAIELGVPFTFTATVAAVGGADTSVTWSSDNETVATVDPGTGAVTGLVVGGQATITATSVLDSTRVDSRVIFVADAVVTSGNDSGPGSLRQVVADAFSGDTVGFAWNVPRVLLTSVQLIPPVDARIQILQSLTISGLPGDRRVTIAGDTVQNFSSRSRIFFVPFGVTASLDNLILTGGDFIGNGGAIRNDGDLTVTNSTITRNTAWFRGGGIYNHGAAAALLVQNSIISENRAVVEDDQLGVNFCIGQPGTVGNDCEASIGTGNLANGGAGGGIYNYGGTVTIENSVISDNEVKYSGGGLYNNGAGTMTLINTDVLNNLASDERFLPANRERVNLGGGIYNQGTFSMTGGTVTGNWSALYGGGIANGITTAPDRPLTLTGVLVTGNTAANFEDHADAFGGGLINYRTDPLANLTIDTGTTITGNVAAFSPDIHHVCTNCGGPAMLMRAPRPLQMPVFGDDGR